MIGPQAEKALTSYDYGLHTQKLPDNIMQDDNDRPSLIMVDERDPSERQQFDLQAETDQTSLLSQEANGGSRFRESRYTLP